MASFPTPVRVTISNCSLSMTFVAVCETASSERNRLNSLMPEEVTSGPVTHGILPFQKRSTPVGGVPPLTSFFASFPSRVVRQPWLAVSPISQLHQELLQLRRRVVAIGLNGLRGNGILPVQVLQRRETAALVRAETAYIRPNEQAVQAVRSQPRGHAAIT